MKKYILSAIPFVIAVICLAAYNMIGSSVAPDGTLNEPFFLIPIFWLFTLIGVIGLIIRFSSHKKS